jgi:hypothetical protein
LVTFGPHNTLLSNVAELLILYYCVFSQHVLLHVLDLFWSLLGCTTPSSPMLQMLALLLYTANDA